MTNDVVSALDRCKVTYRSSVYIISAILIALGHNLNDFTLNKTSYHKKRTLIRQKNAETIKNLFEKKEISTGVIHWDGKIILDKTTNKKMDRLPIVLTVGKSEKLLSAPGLENGKGITQALAIYDTLTHWNLKKSIKALCCDTTNSNLGNKKGAAVILEQLLDVNLLYLPCRHHIFEIILAGIFEVKFPGSTGPNVVMFKNFQDKWTDLDKNNFHYGYAAREMHSKLLSQKESIKSFIKNLLKKKWPGSDYKELLQLCLIFLDGAQGQKVKFLQPGAYHHARWMSKAIYSLKIYLFRKSFALPSVLERSLFDLCQFIVFVYVK